MPERLKGAALLQKIAGKSAMGVRIARKASEGVTKCLLGGRQG